MRHRDCELPVLTFYMGNGSPYLQIYGFVFFYLVGFVDLVFGDIFTTLKLVMAVVERRLFVVKNTCLLAAQMAAMVVMAEMFT